MRIAYRISAFAMVSALTAMASLGDAAAKKKPEEGCGPDRMRICGTKAKAKCDLRQHLDELSPACFGGMEKKDRKKERKKAEKSAETMGPREAAQPNGDQETSKSMR